MKKLMYETPLLEIEEIERTAIIATSTTGSGDLTGNDGGAEGGAAKQRIDFSETTDANKF